MIWRQEQEQSTFILKLETTASYMKWSLDDICSVVSQQSQMSHFDFNQHGSIVTKWLEHGVQVSSNVSFYFQAGEIIKSIVDDIKDKHCCVVRYKGFLAYMKNYENYIELCLYIGAILTVVNRSDCLDHPYAMLVCCLLSHDNLMLVYLRVTFIYKTLANFEEKRINFFQVLFYPLCKTCKSLILTRKFYQHLSFHSNTWWNI